MSTQTCQHIYIFSSVCFKEASCIYIFYKSSYRRILIDVSVIPSEHGGQLSIKQKMCGMNLLLAVVVSSLIAGVSGEPFKIRICADISFFNV